MNLGGQCCRGGRSSRSEAPEGDRAGKSSFWEGDLLRRAGGRWKAWGRGEKPGERSEWSLQVMRVLRKESSYGDGCRRVCVGGAKESFMLHGAPAGLGAEG